MHAWSAGDRCHPWRPGPDIQDGSQRNDAPRQGVLLSLLPAAVSRHTSQHQPFDGALWRHVQPSMQVVVTRPPDSVSQTDLTQTLKWPFEWHNEGGPCGWLMPRAGVHAVHGGQAG